MIKIVEGNILNATENIIAHQVNCRGIMGGGLALQIKNKYPEIFNYYFNYIEDFKINNSEAKYLLGCCQIVYTSDGNKAFANLFGQYNIGQNKVQTDYMALRRSLNKLLTYAKENKNSIAIPYKLGCGLAGGDWNIVYKIIEDVFEDYDVTIYKFKQ